MLRFLYLFVFSSIQVLLFSQEQGIAPLSGEAGAASVSAQSTLINQTSGAVSYSVPVMSITDGSLAVPIQANYYSQGHVLQDRGGVIGLGWSLSVGGSVTREVRGIPDDCINGKWFLDFNAANNTDRTQALNLVKDAESDIFRYTAGAYSGAFYIDKIDGVVQVPQSDNIIELEQYVGSQSQTGVFQNGFVLGFRVITPDGTIFHYGGLNNDSPYRKPYISFSSHPSNLAWKPAVYMSSLPGSTYAGLYPTTFHLTKVEALSGSRLEYQYNDAHTEEFSYPFLSNYKVHTTSSICTNSANQNQNCFPSRETENWYQGSLFNLYLSKILAVNSQEEIIFKYEGYWGSGKLQYLLAEVEKNVGPLGSLVGFVYEDFESLPLQANHYSPESQYSSAQNNSVVKKPALKKIVPFSTWDPPAGGDAPDVPHYTFSYNGMTGHPYPFPEYADRHSKPGGGYWYSKYATNHDYAGYASQRNWFYGIPSTNFGNVTYGISDRNPDYNLSRRTLLREVILPTKGKIEYTYEPNERSVYEKEDKLFSVSCTPNSFLDCKNNCPYPTGSPFTITNANIAGAEVIFYTRNYHTSYSYIDAYLTLKNLTTNQQAVYSFSVPATGENTIAVPLSQVLSQLFGSSFPMGDYIGCIKIDGSIYPSNTPYATIVASARITTDAWQRNEQVAGHRVSKVRIIDNTSPNYLDIDYKYNRTVAGSTNMSSGYTRGTPKFHESNNTFIKFNTEQSAYLSFSSGSTIHYTDVTKEIQGLGKEVRRYNVPDNFGLSNYSAPSKSATLFDRNFGLLLSESYFEEGSSVPYKSVTYDYTDSFSETNNSHAQYTVKHSLNGATVASPYYHPISIPARLKSISSIEDGRLTKTNFTYVSQFKNPYPRLILVDLPDGSQSYEYKFYTRIYHLNSTVKNFLVQKNAIAIEYSSYHGRNWKFHGRKDLEFSFFNSLGNPTSSPSATTTLALRKVHYQSKASNSTGNNLDNNSSTARVDIDVQQVFPDGVPKKFIKYGDQLVTTLTRTGGLVGQLSSRTVGSAVNSYLYQNRQLSSSTGPDGISYTYEYDNQNRLEKRLRTCDGSSVEYEYNTKYYLPGTQFSVLKTTSKSSTSDADYVVWSTIDGLGRKIQTQATGSSSTNPNAGANGLGMLLTKTEYDKYGRVSKKYQEHTISGPLANEGRTLAIPLANARWSSYSYESSPRSRVKSKTLNNGFSTSYDYLYNLGTISHIGGGFGNFSANKLQLVRSIDHENYISETYTDSWGNTILTQKLSLTSSQPYQVVKYGYDVQNQLMKVVPMGVSSTSPSEVFTYKYDHFGRQLESKIPGQSVGKVLYDSQGKMVAQETPHTSNLNTPSHWEYLYDSYNNLIKTGLVPGALPSTAPSNIATAYLTDEVVYSYTAGNTNFLRPSSSKTRMLDDGSWITTSLSNNGPCGATNLVQTSGQPGLSSGGATRDRTYFDSRNRPYRRLSTATIPGHTVYNRQTSYFTADDKVDRVQTYLRAGVNSSSYATKYYGWSSQVEFSSLGDLQYSRNDYKSGAWLQQVDYSYDNIGRLTQINQPLHQESSANRLTYDVWGGNYYRNNPAGVGGLSRTSSQNLRDVYFQKINYGIPMAGGVASSSDHDGLIKEVMRSTLGRKPVLESYGYDSQLRLNEYLAKELNSSTQTSYSIHAFNQHAKASYSYDNLSRPTIIEREGLEASGVVSNQQFDNLSYNYSSGGVAQAAPKTVVDATSYSTGHQRYTSTSGYSYNTAGSVTYDPYKRLRYTYNALGLADKISVAWGAGFGEYVLYRYSSDGTLRESIKHNSSGVEIERINFINGHRYNVTENEVLVATDAGSTILDAQNNAKNVRYQSDHLGNIILAYSDLNGDGVISTQTEYLEENRYYPYGLKLDIYSTQSSTLPFAFNGAEHDDDYNLHLTTFRTSATEIGLWGQVDPKAEWQYHLSPYSSMNGNPITYADPDGDIAPILVAAAIGAVVGGAGNTFYQWRQGNVTNLGSGLKAFGIGAVAGGVGAAAASFVVMGGAALGTGALASSVSYSGLSVAGYSLGTTGVVSGAATGAIGGAVSGPLRQGGNMWAGWQDEFSFRELGLEIGSGLVIGGIAGGIAGGLGKGAPGNPGMPDPSLGNKILWGNSVRVPGAGSIAVGPNGRVIDANTVANLANNQGLQTAQRGALDQAKIQSLLADMDAGTFDATKYAVGGYRDGARIIITEGNHRITAALVHGMKTGDYGITNQLINAGRFSQAPSGMSSFNWISKWK